MSAAVDVLLIEDEPNIAEAVRFVLARDGWNCESWAQGTGAIERIRLLTPRMLILDLMLPGRSGGELLAELRADPDLCHLPVLLLSACGGANMPTEANLILAKPFANADLRAAVRDLLGAP